MRVRVDGFIVQLNGYDWGYPLPCGVGPHGIRIICGWD
jgi:hypothetical protein